MNLWIASGSFLANSGRSVLKHAKPTMLGIIGIMVLLKRTLSRDKEEDVTQSLQYCDQQRVGSQYHRR
jgi:hypothetical protein